jgi:hypothetical protein
MKAWHVCLLGGLLLGAPLASAEVTIRLEKIPFEECPARLALTGTIRGDQIVDYSFVARAGKSMAARFKPSNLSAHFNVLPPGSGVAMFVGSTSGNHLQARLPIDGEYTIRVYLMRNAARRNEMANYTLELDVACGDKAAASLESTPGAGLSFDRMLELRGIRFHVSSANQGSLNTLRIVPAGLDIDNSPIVRTIDGTVTGAEVVDLNGDGSPEVYVYVTSAGSGSYGSLVAYSANRHKSLSEIALPAISENKVAAKGYQGHDAFAVVENVLVQRFPVYRDGDINARPTGGTRQLQYKLVPGEAGWMLKVDRVVEY